MHGYAQMSGDRMKDAVVPSQKLLEALNRILDRLNAVGLGDHVVRERV